MSLEATVCKISSSESLCRVMKILQLISSGGVYGAEVMMVTLAKSLERLGCKNLVGLILQNTQVGDTVIKRHLELLTWQIALSRTS